jgi:hypothetical protein
MNRSGWNIKIDQFRQSHAVQGVQPGLKKSMLYGH